MAETTIKTVPCRYAGITFRSTLEADWAATFDHYRIAWEYEPVAVETEEGPYLPDFWLPESQVWAEVKGPHNQRLDKVLALRKTQPVIILRPSIGEYCAWDKGYDGKNYEQGLSAASGQDHGHDLDFWWPRLSDKLVVASFEDAWTPSPVTGMTRDRDYYDPAERHCYGCGCNKAVAIQFSSASHIPHRFTAYLRERATGISDPSYSFGHLPAGWRPCEESWVNSKRPGDSYLPFVRVRDLPE